MRDLFHVHAAQCAHAGNPQGACGLSGGAHLQALQHTQPPQPLQHTQPPQPPAGILAAPRYHAAQRNQWGTPTALVSCQGALTCSLSSTQPSQPPADTRIAPTSAPCGTSSAPVLRRSLRQQPSVWFPVPL